MKLNNCQRWSIAPSRRGDSLYKAIVAIMHKINKIRAIIRNSDTRRFIVTSLEVINYRQRFKPPLAVNLIYNTIKRTIKTTNKNLHHYDKWYIASEVKNA
jgi:hypothetical protein